MNVWRYLSAIRLRLRMRGEQRKIVRDSPVLSHVAAGAEKLEDEHETEALSDPDTRLAANLSGISAEMANLSDSGGGTLKAKGATWTLTGPNSGTVALHTDCGAGVSPSNGEDNMNSR